MIVQLSRVVNASLLSDLMVTLPPPVSMKIGIGLKREFSMNFFESCSRRFDWLRLRVSVSLAVKNEKEFTLALCPWYPWGEKVEMRRRLCTPSCPLAPDHWSTFASFWIRLGKSRETRRMSAKDHAEAFRCNCAEYSTSGADPFTKTGVNPICSISIGERRNLWVRNSHWEYNSRMRSDDRPIVTRYALLPADFTAWRGRCSAMLSYLQERENVI